MSKSFRHSSVWGDSKSWRGFYLGLIQRMKKSRRYKIKACVDEEGTPILPAHISKAWPECNGFSGSRWRNEVTPPLMTVHRRGRKILTYSSYGMTRDEQRSEWVHRFK